MEAVPSHHHSLGGDYDKSMKNSSSYSVWNNFFLSAGIPDTVANEYAVTFSQHRIRIDMLKEITKEILLDMGIKAMGDIIAILRHAKNLYTQDELKGGLKTTSSPVACVPSKFINQRPLAMDQISQRTPITTNRSGPSISSLVGGKIQSRVSSNSGALMGSNNSTAQSELNNNKRFASTISTSMAKRLRPAPTLDSAHATANLPEKTLTVHYPSGAAIAKAQQRVLAGSSSSLVETKLSSRNSASIPIKSRLGFSPANGGKFRSDTTATISTSSNSSINNDNTRKGWSRSHSNLDQNSSSSGKRSDSKGRLNDKREDVRHQQKGRLKSTVFNRLGDGAR